MSDWILSKAWMFVGAAVIFIAVHSGMKGCESSRNVVRTGYRLRATNLEIIEMEARNQIETAELTHDPVKISHTQQTVVHLSPQERAELAELRARIAKEDVDNMGK